MIIISLSALFQKLKTFLFGTKKEAVPKKKRRHVEYTPVSHSIGYLKANGKRIRLVNNRHARNPSYEELVDFLNHDNTETLPYRPGEFVCADFAQVLHNRAEKYGIRAGWVALDFTEGEGHACNVFQTIDKGLVFVDCTNSPTNDEYIGYDATVEVRVNREYRPKEINDECYYRSMGIVKKYKIFW